MVPGVGAPEAAAAGSFDASFSAITPCRVTDSRQPGAGGAFASFATRSFQVAGSGSRFATVGGTPDGCAIPVDATAVEATVTAVGPTGTGYLRAWPAGSPQPTATFLNFQGGESIGNTGTLPLAPEPSTFDLSVQVFGASTQVVIDITGYFSPSGGQPFTSVTPCRLVDTRSAAAGPLGATARTFQVASSTFGPLFASQGGDPSGCAIPADATAIEATLTAVGPTGTGYSRAWPAGTALPNATFLNFTSGESIGNTGTVPIATSNSRADLTVAAFGAGTHLVVDVTGYFAPDTGATATPSTYVAVTPCRIVDTRQAGAGGTFGPGEARTYQVAGTGAGLRQPGRQPRRLRHPRRRRRRRDDHHRRRPHHRRLRPRPPRRAPPSPTPPSST